MSALQVSTVTTSDRSLLHAVRATLAEAEEAFLCVAFVQEKGVHLIEKELEELSRRRAPARLLVTTTFQTTSAPALGMARRLGLDVRVLNPGSGSTFPPSVSGRRCSAGTRISPPHSSTASPTTPPSSRPREGTSGCVVGRPRKLRKELQP